MTIRILSQRMFIPGSRSSTESTCSRQAFCLTLQLSQLPQEARTFPSWHSIFEIVQSTVRCLCCFDLPFVMSFFCLCLVCLAKRIDFLPITKKLSHTGICRAALPPCSHTTSAIIKQGTGPATCAPWSPCFKFLLFIFGLYALPTN